MRYSHENVAISGLPGSGKSTAIKLLSEKTGLTAYSFGDELRRRYSLEPKEIRDRKPFELWWPLIPIPELRELNYHLYGRVESGLIGIADTRYASIYSPRTLKIFLAADISVRAERNKKRYPGQTTKEIVEILKRRENDELQVGMDIWGQDYNYRRQDDYDVILNTDRLTPEEVCAAIAVVLKKC